MHHRNGLNSYQKKILQEGQASDHEEEFGGAALIEPIRRNCQDLSLIIEGLNDLQREDLQPLDFVQIVNPV